MDELRLKFYHLVKSHEGSSAGERKIKIATKLLDDAEKGEVDAKWAMQVMRRLHGYKIIE